MSSVNVMWHRYEELLRKNALEGTETSINAHRLEKAEYLSCIPTHPPPHSLIPQRGFQLGISGLPLAQSSEFETLTQCNTEIRNSAFSSQNSIMSLPFPRMVGKHNVL